MGKVIKIREVGEPSLGKTCDEVNINKIDAEILDIIEDLKATLEFNEKRTRNSCSANWNK